MGSHKLVCPEYKVLITADEKELEFSYDGPVVDPALLPPWQSSEGGLWVMTTDDKGRSTFFRALKSDPRSSCRYVKRTVLLGEKRRRPMAVLPTTLVVHTTVTVILCPTGSK